jgi:hypothetical protein
MSSLFKAGLLAAVSGISGLVFGYWLATRKEKNRESETGAIPADPVLLEVLFFPDSTVDGLHQMTKHEREHVSLHLL